MKKFVTSKIETISPYDGSVCVTKVSDSDTEVEAIINNANEAFKVCLYKDMNGCMFVCFFM